MSYRTTSALSTGVFLGALGAILYFAVTATVAGIDIDTVGAILMVAGAVVTLFGLVSMMTEHNGSEVHSTTVDGTTTDGKHVRETHQKVS